MKNIFSSFMPPTSVLREDITRFIVQSLQPYADEKTVSLKGIRFYIACDGPQSEAPARLALYMDKPVIFRQQLERKLLDHFILLDPDWFFEPHVVQQEALPVNCIRKNNFGLQVLRTGEQTGLQCSPALVQVLAGQAEHNEFTLDPTQQEKFYIGRTSNPQLGSGKVQHNDIVFLDSPGSSVSRNHAYIVYDHHTNTYSLYPDKGGLPENGNKLKIHTHDDKVKWLNIYGVSHTLHDGDQVELGGAAVLRFRVIAP
jgi:hypothetical protein